MQKGRKRSFQETPNRDDHWMALAFVLAAGSNYRQQACIIVNLQNEVVGMGVDGSPKPMPNDCDHVIHSEMNALLSCKTPINGGVVYLTHTPCYSCSLGLLASNIKRVVYFPTKKIDENTLNAFQTAYAQAEEFKGNLNWMRDYMKSLDIFSR